jgi:hypothetical protein
MYAQLKSCVKSPGGLSDFFNCNVGTKQGGMLSPFLFVIFLNEFIDLLESANCKGIFVDEHVPNLLQLMFADDMAHTEDTVVNLQKHIDV